MIKLGMIFQPDRRLDIGQLAHSAAPYHVQIRRISSNCKSPKQTKHLYISRKQQNSLGCSVMNWYHACVAACFVSWLMSSHFSADISEHKHVHVALIEELMTLLTQVSVSGMQTRITTTLKQRIYKATPTDLVPFYSARTQRTLLSSFRSGYT